jgi:5'-deoxynucleotidase YfbR-like HD superfamily hydrolase
MTHGDWRGLIDEASLDIRRLSSVWRYSSIPIVIQENVAEHLAWVAIYAVMIHKHGPEKDDSYLAAILMKAITHDLGEALTGDVIRPLKYETEELRKEVNRAEERISCRLFGQLVKNLFIITDDLTDNTDREYVEAVVKAADFLSLFQFMRREASKSNLEILPFYDRMVRDIHEKAIICEEEVNGFKQRRFYQDLEGAARERRHAAFGLKAEDWKRDV